MICHLDWIQNTKDIILIPRNHLDKLWFTLSEEVIVKFPYFFLKIYKTFNIQFKRWISSSLCQDTILSQKTCQIYTADLSQISWKYKTGNFVISCLLWVLTFCSFHRIEQNICLVGTSINKGCAVYYYSVVMHGLRIIRYLWTKCREKSVLRRLHRREQHAKFCIDSSKRSYRVDVVIAMWYTALYKITASFRQTKKKVWCHVGWTAGTSAMRRSKG